MKVYIRHATEAVGDDCGEMNPDQLHHFVASVRTRGVYRSDPGVLDDLSEAIVQYVRCPERGFLAEIVYGDEA